MATREDRTDGPGRAATGDPDPRSPGTQSPNLQTPGRPSSARQTSARQTSGRQTSDTDRYADRNHTIDADEDDWAWRARIRANPTTRLVYRVVIAVLGLAVVALGIVLLPAPGPGWLIIFVGLGIWASEFEWAQQVLEFAKRHVRRWTSWVGTQPIWIKGLVGLGCVVLVLAVFYVTFLLTGVPTWIWTFAQDFLRSLPGLS